MSDERLIAVHFDMKYLQPTEAFLLEHVRRLPEFGINAVLLEYEDKFPFRKYPFLAGRGAWTPESLRTFLDTARGVGLRVIPLVQTISHLEFALWHEPLAHLREAPDMPTQLCPSNPEALGFVQDLLDEVLAYHEDEPLVHIGADEAWHLGECPKCAERLAALNGDVPAFWAEHVGEVCRRMLARGKRPIVWDDVFRQDAAACRHLPEGTIIDSWSYSDTEIDVEKFPWKNLPVYREHGYDVVGSPCGNGGALIAGPRGLYNTATWARIFRETDLLGVFNTFWDCFHTQRPLDWMAIAATGATCRGEIDWPDAAWQEDFFEREFGVRVPGVAEALEDITRGWGVDADLGRRLNVPFHAYTDMVAHYPNHQTERRRRGIYPLDWDTIDFIEIARKKMDAARELCGREEIDENLDKLITCFGKAHDVFAAVALGATRHGLAAELYALCAEMKLLSARVTSHVLRCDGSPDALRNEIVAQKKDIERVFSRFLIPRDVRRVLRMYNEPLYALVAGRLGCPCDER